MSAESGGEGESTHTRRVHDERTIVPGAKIFLRESRCALGVQHPWSNENCARVIVEFSQLPAGRLVERSVARLRQWNDARFEQESGKRGRDRIGRGDLKLAGTGAERGESGKYQCARDLPRSARDKNRPAIFLVGFA